MAVACFPERIIICKCAVSMIFCVGSLHMRCEWDNLASQGCGARVSHHPVSLFASTLSETRSSASWMLPSWGRELLA